jgi:hypothetical protein
LCRRTPLPCPAWVHQHAYPLEKSWFFSAEDAQQRWLLATTPEPFQRRNIFVGGSVLDNKYERQHLFGSKPRWSPWSDQDLQKRSEAKDLHLSKQS